MDASKIDLNESIFTYSDMLRTWDEAILSFSKEIGNDVSEEEKEAPIFSNFKSYITEVYHLKLK